MKFRHKISKVEFNNIEDCLQHYCSAYEKDIGDSSVCYNQCFYKQAMGPLQVLGKTFLSCRDCARLVPIQTAAILGFDVVDEDALDLDDTIIHV